MEIKVDELPKDILFLLRLKANEFKNEGVHTINVEDIKEYLLEVKWKQTEELPMCEMIDDIMSLNFSSIFDYLKMRVIREASHLNIDDFNDLISK